MSSSASSMVYLSPFKKWLTIAICLVSLLYAAPNVLPREIIKPLAEISSRWLPVHPVNLGLDLQGGAYLLLKVDIAVALRDRMNGTLDGVRQALQDKRIGYIGLEATETGVLFNLRNAEDAGAMARLARDVDAGLSADVSGQKVSFVLSEMALEEYRRQIIDQSIEIVRRRVDESGTKEPIIQRSGNDRILLQLPGVSDPQQIKRLLGQTAKMTFHLVDEAATMSGGLSAPAGYVALPDRDNPMQRVVVRRQPSLFGESLTNATSGRSETGQSAVHFSFNSMGARTFAQITRENVGQQFAIVLDGKVLTAPNINEPITGGSGQITGNFTPESAQELALLLRAGALPAPLTVLEERTVGPGLGKDAVDAGKVSGVIGFALVVLWMFVSYGRFGMYANVALAINVAMIFALFSVLGVTLTLPGIAAIILTIGMAVDANVLVYERIREEIRLGRTPLSAVDAGYSRAMPSVVDSNLTTIIAGVILFFLGSGPIQGFAVALTLGILTTLFSAIMITRIMVLRYLRVAKPATLNI